MARQALGRGLNALFGDGPRRTAEVLVEVDVQSLDPCGEQPRKDFDERRLKELATSIEQNGVIQPVVVRRKGEGRYEIVAGERRWRAVRSLGRPTIPAVIRDVAPDRRLELALVENIQREDLNPIEEARAYEALLRDHGLTQEQVAERVGKERATVANMVRLLKLPEELQEELRLGRLGMGHARALLALPTGVAMRELARRVESDGLTVRQTEELVRAQIGARAERRPARSRKDGAEAVPRDVHDRAAEKKLGAALDTKVSIQRRRKGGAIQIAFYSEEDLMRLYDLLSAKQRAAR